MGLIQMMPQGHRGNIPQGKHLGEIGTEIGNNEGVFQGSPISAILYITFADGITGEYKNELHPHNAQKIKMVTHDLQVDFDRG